jgi:hypothetical protein
MQRQPERVYEPDLAREVSALLLVLGWRQTQEEGAPSWNLETPQATETGTRTQTKAPCALSPARKAAGDGS